MPEHNSTRPTARCPSFCLNQLQIEHCLFVWHSAALVLHIMWQPHFSRLRSLSRCPWCIFHVCWKDKHSCNLMTLKCFWDSEYMCASCVFFCVRPCSLQQIPVEALKNHYTVPPCMFMRVQGSAKWQPCLPFTGLLSQRVLIALHYFTLGPRSPVCKTTTRKNTQHMQINAHTSTARRPPRRDEAECELQMKLKTEALLSDKWDKYAHGPSLPLTFTRCTSLTPHKWSRLLSSGINLPI